MHSGAAMLTGDLRDHACHRPVCYQNLATLKETILRQLKGRVA